MRIDKYLFDKGLAKSRTHARELVVSGLVCSDGKAVTKPSFDVDDGSEVTVTGEICPYVSRGGLKLESALDLFEIGVEGSIALDIGASTGGFTDVLLRRGAAKVYAVDSGHGQLARSLLQDERVVSMEGFNARNLSPDDLGSSVSVAVCDVSFISQTLIHQAAYDCLCEGGVFIGLVKPQFECTKEALSKGGIIKEDRYRISASEKVFSSLCNRGFSIVGFAPSPITGGDGNTEYLICARKEHNVNKIEIEYLRSVILEKHSHCSTK